MILRCALLLLFVLSLAGLLRSCAKV